MKKKRKYTRKPDAPQSTEKPTKEESSIIGKGNIIAPFGKLEGQDFTFNDLPLSLRIQVENAIKLRKRLGLPDDSKERKERAIKMFRGDRPRA